jgi:predicted ATPase
LLSESTGGNPFFVTEVVRELRRSEGPLTTLPIPESVRTLIGERLTRLPPGNRQVLEALAMLGSPMMLAILQQTSARSEDETVSAIEIGLRWGMVSAQGENGDIRYDFSHDLVRSAVAGQLSAVRRQVLHRRAAETLETTQASAAVLTYHWALAGNQEKERNYAALAGEQTAAQSANAEAVAYLTRALALTPMPAQVERYRLLLAREKVFSTQGELERQEQDLAALQQLADALDDNEKRAEVAIRYTYYLLNRGKPQDACLLAEKAVGLARASENKRIEAHGRTQWSLALWKQGRFLPAQEQARQAYSLLQSEKLQAKEPRILILLGNIAWALDDDDGASAYFEQALPVCRTVGDRVSEGDTLNNLAIIAINRGDYRAATAYHEQALQIYRESGRRLSQARSLVNLGELYLDQGAYAAARQFVEEAISLSEEIGAWRDVYRHRARLSLIRHYQGDHHAARRLLESVLVAAQEADDDYTLADVWTKLGHMRLDAGEGAAAAAAYEQALTLQRQVGSPKYVIECLAGLAGSLLREEELGRAQAQVETILDFLQTNTVNGAIEPFRIYWACYLVLHTTQDARAHDVLRQAYTLLQKRAATTVDLELKHSFLEHVPAHRNIVKAYDARTG